MMFASKLDNDGELVWNAFVETDFEVKTADMVKVNDTTVMIYGLASNGIYYATVSSNGNILEQQLLSTNNEPSMDTQSQIVQVSQNEYVGIYTYDNSNFAMVNFTLSTPSY